MEEKLYSLTFKMADGTSQTGIIKIPPGVPGPPGPKGDPGVPTEEAIRAAVEAYFARNYPDGGVGFETDETLILKDGVLSVNTTNDMEKDNTLPITSAGVYATVGNIEALLKTI